ncbi:MAG TPA: hypothetical protein VFP20_02940 [Bacteroidales bacterium]|nr:hypothetical protein [Bacteroidales bacterium]
MIEKGKNKQTDLEVILIISAEVLKKLWKYLLSKWVIIVVFGIGGSAIGLIASLISKPDYKAHLTFALIENTGGSSGLAALASSFGFGGLSSSDDAFSGDNLLEILKSRHAIEQTLLAPVHYKTKQMNLAEVYIHNNELHDAWKNAKNKELRNLTFPIGQKRETFTRTQDSVMYVFYRGIVETGALTVAKKDKKTGIVNVDFTSKDEDFSKLFVETLMKVTYKFYKDTRTSQSKANIDMMEVTADSIKHLYESALSKGASYSQLNINAAIQTAAVPRIKQENNAQLYATVYAEVLKNLETLKLDLARQTPLVQIIDSPILPLEKNRLGKAKGMVIGGIIGGVLIVIFLLARLYLRGLFIKKEN